MTITPESLSTTSRNTCKRSAGTVEKHQVSRNIKASPGAPTTGGGSPGNRTLNLRIKSLIKSVSCTCGFGPKLCFSQAQPIASE